MAEEWQMGFKPGPWLQSSHHLSHLPLRPLEKGSYIKSMSVLPVASLFPSSMISESTQYKRFRLQPQGGSPSWCPAVPLLILNQRVSSSPAVTHHVLKGLSFTCKMGCCESPRWVGRLLRPSHLSPLTAEGIRGSEEASCKLGPSHTVSREGIQRQSVSLPDPQGGEQMADNCLEGETPRPRLLSGTSPGTGCLVSSGTGRQ